MERHFQVALLYRRTLHKNTSVNSGLVNVGLVNSKENLTISYYITTMTNPLISMLQTSANNQTANLPPFAHIKPEHVEPAIDLILSENRQQLLMLLDQKEVSWDNFNNC